MLHLIYDFWQGVEGIERDANKAASANQKEGAKGSMAAMKVYMLPNKLIFWDEMRHLASPTDTTPSALQDNVSAAAGQAKEKMSAKGEKNKAEAQTSAYNTRSKAANKIDPHT